MGERQRKRGRIKVRSTVRGCKRNSIISSNRLNLWRVVEFMISIVVLDLFLGMIVIRIYPIIGKGYMRQGVIIGQKEASILI